MLSACRRLVVLSTAGRDRCTCKLRRKAGPVAHASLGELLAVAGELLLAKEGSGGLAWSAWVDGRTDQAGMPALAVGSHGRARAKRSRCRSTERRGRHVAAAARAAIDRLRATSQGSRLCTHGFSHSAAALAAAPQLRREVVRSTARPSPCSVSTSRDDPYVCSQCWVRERGGSWTLLFVEK